MIAGFWDDLQVSFGSGVYKYDDAANHRFIIEYRNVKNDYQMANERFQIILYNPLYYPTPTGDGEIVIQYQDINDVDDADNYSTVGIEDYYHTTGLQYVFSDIYDASSRELADGLAIKFTTDPGTASAPQLELTVNPVNPPIIIPPGGGTFSFTVTIHNVGNDTAEFDFWTEAILPSGSLFSPILQRSDLIILPGAIFTRTLTQFIPASAPAGTYTYRGVVGDNSIGSIYDFQEFTFIKSAAR
jgi:hypothetical protein